MENKTEKDRRDRKVSESDPAGSQKNKHQQDSGSNASEGDKRSEHGGLPDRDLKKNLGGC